VSDWWEDAACRGMGPELFVDALPHDQWREANFTAETRRRIEEAKQVCGDCPVVGPCRDDAIATNDFSAIRGNLTPVELRAYARARAAIRGERFTRYQPDRVVQNRRASRGVG